MDDLKKPFIDYYNRYNIIPVSQDISDIKQHFQRRDALYRHCGIPSVLVKDRTVLEVGPGTGHNALYTNSLKPSRYVLVDGAKQSIRNLTDLFEKSFPDISNCEIIESALEALSLDEQFDIVLCEGAIPFQKQPADFLKSLSGFVKPSGILLITCADSVSYFSEILRRIMAQLILSGHPELEMKEKLEILRPVFTNHLKNLSGMSRPVDDWIYDNILQPFIGQPLSIGQAIHALEDTFDVYASSPHMFSDWRWYKDIHGDGQLFNTASTQIFKKNIHNLLDYRYLFDPIDEKKGDRIIELCDAVFDLSIDIQDTGIQDKLLHQTYSCLRDLERIVSEFSAETGQALEEFAENMSVFIEKKACSFDKMDRFAPWFGRGQQYLSFIKKA